VLFPAADRECIRDVKEKCCYVALDFSNEKSETDWSACQKKVQLPDGQEVSLGQETFFCPEILFQSKLIGESMGRGRNPRHGHRVLSSERRHWGSQEGTLV
jgi:hypothetical protein